jgi:phosphohistidine phosphatase
MICYFLRHGIAADAARFAGSDRDRPLTGKGIEKMTAVAKRLAEMDVVLDCIVTSPLLRAKQTAQIVADALGLRPVEDARLGPGFSYDRLREVLGERRDANAIMLVGHEPAMSETVGDAIGGASIDFKKGAIAAVEFPDPQSARGVLLWMASPKILT